MHAPGEDELLRARCARAFESLGFEAGLRLLIESARKLLESSPVLYGHLEAQGTRYLPIVDAAARRCEDARTELGHDHRNPPSARTAILPATVFTSLAYGHAYNDGNKRTGFLAATSLGRGLGFSWRGPLRSGRSC